MLPFFGYSNNVYASCCFFFFILLLFLPAFTFPARNMMMMPPPPPPPAGPVDNPLTELTNMVENNTWHNFLRLVDAEKGSQIKGMSELKKYFQRFGYLSIPADKNLTDLFDENLETALLSYQNKLGLPVTGKLDSTTMQTIISPRCGVSDTAHKLHFTKHYAYFYGKPRWTRSSPTIILTYAFSPTHMIDYISMSEIKSAFERSFSRWSAVIPVNFTEAESYWTADIKIGFYKGDHGDGEPFDGKLGVLAHAFSPENGRFHLDGAETWAVDLEKDKSDKAVDLESVATHEIGHILGLAHSSVQEAVMYPSLSPRTKKVDLKIDDVEGVQALYGSNPNFSYTALLESERSSSWDMMAFETRRSTTKLTCFFSLLLLAWL